jgi:hypothetical protein
VIPQHLIDGTGHAERTFLVLVVHVGRARRCGTHLFLRSLDRGHLRGQQQSRDRGGVLECESRHLAGVENPLLNQVAMLACHRVVAVITRFTTISA